MRNKTLDRLVSNNTILSYEYANVNECGEYTSAQEGARNSERLKITFTNGESILIDTVCSGCLEHTSMIIE